jgi:repressor LexA
MEKKEFQKMVGKRIKELRKEAGLTQKQLAEKCGISQSYLADLEGGRFSPSLQKLSAIANVLGVNPSELIKRGDESRSDPDLNFIDLIAREEIPLTPAVKIPVVGIIRAGEPILAVQNIIGYVELPEDLAKDGEYFGLRVIGDSMNLDRICDGDIVIVRRQSVVNNGEIAVVMVDNENATIKRFYKTDSTITLVPHSSNPEHKPRVIDPSKTNVIVLGKVVRAIINF